MAQLLALLLFLVSLLSCLAESESSASQKAAFTYYSSYPFCCPDSPNYDPTAPKDECDDYSGCKYMGDFAAFVSPSNPDGHVSFQYVTSHNLVAFYDNSDPQGKHWASRYANRKIQISKVYQGKSHVFNATIVDTCSNGDCNGCCSRNANKATGFLLDMEYYTVMRHFGSTDAADGDLQFVLV